LLLTIIASNSFFRKFINVLRSYFNGSFEHLKDIIDNEFECLIDIENDQEHKSRSFDHVNLENLAIFMKEKELKQKNNP
jgi:hypothetical protein